MRNLINRFCMDESGTTAIEYGLIASLICLVIIASITNVGSGVGNKWNMISNKV